ncbi:MAG: SLBB domain-containing protein, partial [Candidatus Cloacimonetes bacterium]|nr:SLBB domain-containing protein [Candidatus Cloacimonadota bacterium]
KPAPTMKLPSLKDSVAADIYGQRNITLIRQGQKQTLDLLKYYRLGDITQNPYLIDNDVIVISPVVETVTLQGSIRRPGEYEYCDGDKLKDLLDIALGVMDDADLRHLILYRYKDGFTEFDKIEINASGYPKKPNSALETPLNAGDRIIVPPNAEYRKAYKVQVRGKVRMPGVYFVDDKTTLYDLLEMSGGPTQEADLGSSFVFNRLVSESFDPDFERLINFSYLQMTWLEYSYLRTKTRQLKGKYSVDVQKCWSSKGKDANLVLRDGDELYVPELLNGIWVAGQVRHPGLVNWTDGWNWKDYLQAAGGYTNNRKLEGTRIIRVHSGNWIKPTKNIILNPGDIIFVPDKEERYIWTDIKEVLLVASQIMTILIALNTLNK